MNQCVPMPKPPALQRARGTLAIRVAKDANSPTRLADLREQGSFRVIFPRAPHDSVEAVILNTAGGIAGGDHYTIDATAGNSTTLALTTQAAERIYKAADQTVGQLHTTLAVENGARLHWLPQETILFDGSRLQRRLDVTLAPDATFLMVEPLVFGREASGETVTSGLFNDRVRITRDDMPIYLDGVSLSGDMSATLSEAAVANGARAMANVVFCHPAAENHLDPIRAALSDTAGASMLNETTLVVRMLAADSFVLRQQLLPIMTRLTDDAVPKNWRL